MPNGHTLAGFAIGNLRFATMATLHLLKGTARTTQNQNLLLRKDFYFLPTQAKKTHLLQLGIHGQPVKCDLHKIMGKIRYQYFQN